MKKQILLIASILLLTGISSFAAGDNSVMYGFSAGYCRSMFSNTISSSTYNYDLLPVFQNASGNGYFIGITTRISLPFLSGTEIKSSFTGKLAYENHPAKGSVLGERYSYLVETSPGVYSTILESTIDYKLDLSYSTVNLGLIYSARLFNSNFSVDLGGSIGIAIQNRYVTSMNLITSPTLTLPEISLKGADSIAKSLVIRFENNDRTGILADDKIPDVQNIRFGFIFGIRYDIKINKFIVSPNLIYNYGNKVSSLNFGVDLLF